MREFCTSGSVGGREGDLPVYPTAAAAATPGNAIDLRLFAGAGGDD